MGKIRSRKKYKMHLKPQGGEPSSKPATTSMEEDCIRTVDTQGDQVIVPLPQEVMKSLPVLTLVAEEKQTETLKKKDRRQMRHKRWLQKVEVCHRDRKEERAAEERRKTVVVGDMKPLCDALPQIDLTSLPEHSHGKSSVMKSRPSTSQQTSVLGEVDHFQKVLHHPAYKVNPLEAISQHIHNAVSMGLT